MVVSNKLEPMCHNSIIKPIAYSQCGLMSRGIQYAALSSPNFGYANILPQVNYDYLKPTALETMTLFYFFAAIAFNQY